MSINRQYGHIAFECDSCGDILETDLDDFDFAYAQAKQQGWKAIKAMSGEWEHRCPDCEDEP
jgi:Fe2+ or Zn2+ uptake regulation protein